MNKTIKFKDYPLAIKLVNILLMLILYPVMLSGYIAYLFIVGITASQYLGATTNIFVIFVGSVFVFVALFFPLFIVYYLANRYIPMLNKKLITKYFPDKINIDETSSKKDISYDSNSLGRMFIFCCKENVKELYMAILFGVSSLVGIWHQFPLVYVVFSTVAVIFLFGWAIKSIKCLKKSCKENVKKLYMAILFGALLLVGILSQFPLAYVVFSIVAVIFLFWWAIKSIKRLKKSCKQNITARPDDES